ncbi:MAG TPA: transglycosylase domain-containing protein [Aliidongia sp.]|uniref:transglycosylase domain-containing protein n=1 Tax=Aliidongia sp. TaxID=1914230 RepID=UPI002DDCEEA9|nr:transglycosylase domain-containing protein [Aliidongia sp.]HEV2678788.1 transglycosylase domain-containing protein [Aliidongia sp.]
MVLPVRHRPIVAALLLGAVLLAGYVWHRSTFVAPSPTAIVTDRHGAFMAQIGGGPDGYGYWPVERVPERVEAAILALEDHRFWDHPGVDPLAVLRALKSNLRSAHRISGASTIAMQVARMQDPASRGYVSKAFEAATALVMTARYGREAVLRQYLALVPFGQNSHGIAHAARWYFDKPVEDLSWAEIAVLSAVPQSPAAMNPGSVSGRARAVDRGRKALVRLHDQGVLDDAAYAQSLVDIDNLAAPQRMARSPDALHAILRIGDLVHKGPPIERVRSTIDLGLQQHVAKLARQRLDALRPLGAEQVSVMVVDRRSMEVLALIGSGRYDAADAGKIDYSLRQRSPGSTLKPFIFAEALEQGDIGPATILNDNPDNGTGIDDADRRFLGPLLPRQALANSRNVPAALLVRLVGLDRTHWFLGNLGLHHEDHPADRYGLTLSVGGMPTTLDRLVSAYGALANEGSFTPLRWYREQAEPPARPVLSATTARLITMFLADPMARLPSFARMGATEYPFPTAVKTGTSQGYRDAWVAAYTDRYLVGVWVGRPDGRPMTGISGASSAALVAHDILLDLHGADADGLNDTMFRPPAGHEPVPLCASTGRPSDGTCAQVLTEFMPANRPVESAVKPAPPSVPARLRIVSPLNHSSFIRNPEAPRGSTFLPLRLSAESGDVQIVWYVDGQPFQVAMASETVQWPIQPGRHQFEARPAYDPGGSSRIEVVIR